LDDTVVDRLKITVGDETSISHDEPLLSRSVADSKELMRRKAHNVQSRVLLVFFAVLRQGVAPLSDSSKATGNCISTSATTPPPFFLVENQLLLECVNKRKAIVCLLLGSFAQERVFIQNRSLTIRDATEC
jgi:hypothetical protein